MRDRQTDRQSVCACVLSCARVCVVFRFVSFGEEHFSPVPALRHYVLLDVPTISVFVPLTKPLLSEEDGPG